MDLNEAKFNITSAHGENGILLAISRILKNKNRIGVEIGAGDGLASNNLHPFIFRNWKILYIEGNEEYYKRLIENTSKYSNVFREKAIVRNGEDLNKILEKFNTPIDFDIFSLDIDNIDFWIWKDLKFEPKVVCVEYNMDLPENSSVIKNFSIPEDLDNKSGPLFGAHPFAWAKLAEKRKYDLISVTRGSNMIFIKSDLNKFPKIDPYNYKYRIRGREFKPEHLEYITTDLEL